MDNYIRIVFIYGSSLFAINFVVFWGTYILHFLALPFVGPGIDYIDFSLRKHFVPYGNSSLLRPRLDPPNLLFRTLLYIYRTHEGNMKLNGFHESQSHPNNWPLLTGVGVYFFTHDSRQIRCFGNVFSYYFAFIGVVCCCFAYKKPQKWDAFVVSVGYCFSYFPFFLIPRVLYLYHYCIPLMIGIVGYGVALDLYLPKRVKGVVIVLSIALVIYFYWLISPYIYALPQRDYNKVIWNNAWVVGDSRHIIEKSQDRHN